MSLNCRIKLAVEEVFVLSARAYWLITRVSTTRSLNEVRLPYEDCAKRHVVSDRRFVNAVWLVSLKA